MPHITRVVIALNPDGTPKGSAVYEAELVAGRVFDLEPRPISADDATALSAVLNPAYTAALADIDAKAAAIAQHEAILAEATSARDAALQRVAEFEAKEDAQAEADAKAVPMAAARIALSRAGKLAAVNAAIASIPGRPGEEAQAWWEFSSMVYRNHPMVAQMTPLIGTAEDVDALFAAAAEIAKTTG